MIRHLIHRVYSPNVAAVIGTRLRAYGVDVSRYDPDFNPDNATLDIDFGILKATEGTSWKDPSFETLYVQVSKLTVKGAYHYLRSDYSGVQQANHFVNILAGKPFHTLAIDFESIGNTVNDVFVRVLYDCLVETERLRPDCKILLYTNPSLYDSIIYPASIRIWGKDVFTKWDLWIAQYYFVPSPDKDPAMPVNRKDWIIWQFSDIGLPAEHGSTSYVDRNVFNGTLTELKNYFGVNSVPIDGYQKIRKYNSDINIRIGKPTRVLVTKPVNGDFIAPLTLVQQLKPNLLINGDGWDKTVKPEDFHEPLSYAASDGDFYKQTTYEFRKYINSNQDLGFSMNHTKPVLPYNLVSGQVPLVDLGVINPALINDTMLNPRTSYGFTQDGRIIACEVDGRSTISAGVTRQQLAMIMQDAGAWCALELDGGDSSVMYNDGIKVSKNGDWINGVRTERWIINAVAFWFNEGDTMDNYEVISAQYNMTLRSEHNTGVVGLESVTVNTPMLADEIWVATSDLYKLINGVNVKINSVGDKWAHVTSVKGVAKNAWVAIVHNGVTYCTYKDLTVPPPTGDAFSLVLTENGVSRRFDGTITSITTL